MDTLLEHRNSAFKDATTKVFSLLFESEAISDNFSWQANKLVQAVRSRHRAAQIILGKELIIKQLEQVKEDREKLDEAISTALSKPGSLLELRLKTLQNVYTLLVEEEELLDLRLKGAESGSENSAGTSEVPAAAAPAPTVQPVNMAAALKEVLEEALMPKMEALTAKMEALADNQSGRFQTKWHNLRGGWAASMAAVPKSKKVS